MEIKKNDSILGSVAKSIGVESDYDYFDQDLVLCINAALSTLLQLGVGPKRGLRIYDRSTTWDQFIQDDERIGMIEEYVVMRVRLMFDPPLNAAVIEAMKEQIKEFEWRLNVAVDPGKAIIEE